jgi:hypothetical protein
MPIKGLTQVRRLPRLGKIKMGVKVKSEKGVEHPQKTDYFVVPPEVAEIYGNKPKSLDILLPVEDEEKWAPQYYKLYSATQGLVCRGDGCAATRLIDTATGDRAHRATKEAVKKEVVCEGRKCPDYISKDGCKEVMSLQFILYKVPGMGIWQIDTSSVNSIININSCSEYIRAVFGKVSWIPLQLTIESKEVQNPESGKRQTVYVLNLRNQMTLLDMVETTRKFQAQLPANTRLLLPPADDATLDPGELAADGEEPEGPEMVETEEPTLEQTTEETESDRLFDKLESASTKSTESKIDTRWVVSTIHELRKKGCTTVTGNALADRFLTKYHVNGPLEGLSMKEVLVKLTPDQAADFCKWLNEQ